MAIQKSTVARSILVGSALAASFSIAADSKAENVNCSVRAEADLRVTTFDLRYVPGNPSGETEIIVRYRTSGPCTTNGRIAFDIWLLGDNGRVEKVTTSNVLSNDLPPETLRGLRWFTDAVVNGEVYEANVTYDHDDNPLNNSGFQTAYSINPPQPAAIFKDGFEEAPAAVAGVNDNWKVVSTRELPNGDSVSVLRPVQAPALKR